MDLEDPASGFTSSTSSNSASSSESLFAFFDPSSTSDLFSSSYYASQSYAAAAVKWVDRSGNKNWDSPMWQLGIFKCSENKQVISCHGAILCCTEQSVQSADSRDSTGRLDKDNVPQTKSVRTRPVFCSMDFVGIGPWTLDPGAKKVHGVQVTHMENHWSIALLNKTGTSVPVFWKKRIENGSIGKQYGKFSE